MGKLFKSMCVVYVGAKLIGWSAKALITIGEMNACYKMGKMVKNLVDEISEEEEESDE